MVIMTPPSREIACNDLCIKRQDGEVRYDEIPRQAVGLWNFL